MSPFERAVLADLAELKTNMRALMGNGQPGRVRLLEERVDQHESILQRAKALGLFVVPAVAVLDLVLHIVAKR